MPSPLNKRLALAGAPPCTRLLAQEGWPQQRPFLVPREEGVAHGERACNGSSAPYTSLCFYGSLGFLHRHSWLQCPHPHPLRLSPYSQQQSSTQLCSPNSTFQHAAPILTGDTSTAGAHRAVARTVRVGLTLSCLPQNSCCTLFR